MECSSGEKIDGIYEGIEGIRSVMERVSDTTTKAVRDLVKVLLGFVAVAFVMMFFILYSIMFGAKEAGKLMDRFSASQSATAASPD